MGDSVLLATIRDKVHAGERLSFDDGLALEEVPELRLALGVGRQGERRHEAHGQEDAVHSGHAPRYHRPGAG